VAGGAGWGPAAGAPGLAGEGAVGLAVGGFSCAAAPPNQVKASKAALTAAAIPGRAKAFSRIP
jgi:hypothetical protein